MAVRTEDLDKAIAEVIGPFDGVSEISAEQREAALQIMFKGKTYWRSCRPAMENRCCSSYYLAYGGPLIRWDIRLTLRNLLC